ncbi:MAG: response regulator [Flammeovirgaceae bacterium]
MGKVKILVVEDEMVIADDICDTLEDLGYEVLEPAINYTEALELLKTDQPDLAILDIQLAGSKDGIDLAWKIKEAFDIPFIFLTSNADARTVERAKKVNPHAYLVKPFNKADLYTSIEIALFNFSKTQQKETEEKEDLIIKNALFVKQKELYYKVKFSDIAYLKSEHVYIELITIQQKKFVIRGSLTKLLERLPENIYRTHRSYAINLDHLEAINSMYILIQDEKIPIGKSYRDDLMARISIE